MGYGGRDGGSEWMGIPADRFNKKKKRVSGNAVKGGFKFKKSAGASASASRFGMDEPGPRRPRPRPNLGGSVKIPAIGGPGRKDWLPGGKKYGTYGKNTSSYTDQPRPRKNMPKMYKRGK
jgi:hypothetical protein